MNIFEINQTQVSIEQISPFSGAVNRMTLNISYDSFMAALECWRDGELIQNAFPMLSADEREFIMTGITPEEWNRAFPA